MPKGIYIYLGQSERDQEIIDLIDQYRLYTGKSWKGFVLGAIADHIAQENQEVALRIVNYLMTNPRKQ